MPAKAETLFYLALKWALVTYRNKNCLERWAFYPVSHAKYDIPIPRECHSKNLEREISFLVIFRRKSQPKEVISDWFFQDGYDWLWVVLQVGLWASPNPLRLTGFKRWRWQAKWTDCHRQQGVWSASCRFPKSHRLESK